MSLGDHPLVTPLYGALPMLGVDHRRLELEVNSPELGVADGDLELHIERVDLVVRISLRHPAMLLEDPLGPQVVEDALAIALRLRPRDVGAQVAR